MVTNCSPCPSCIRQVTELICWCGDLSQALGKTFYPKDYQPCHRLSIGITCNTVTARKGGGWEKQLWRWVQVCSIPPPAGAWEPGQPHLSVLSCRSKAQAWSKRLNTTTCTNIMYLEIFARKDRGWACRTRAGSPKPVQFIHSVSWKQQRPQLQSLPCAVGLV